MPVKVQRGSHIHHLNLDHSATILIVKQNLQSITGIDFATIELRYGDVLLRNDNATLASYKIPTDATIVMDVVVIGSTKARHTTQKDSTRIDTKLPTDHIHATQDKVKPGKVSGIAETFKAADKYPKNFDHIDVVLIDGKYYTIDHHRAVAAAEAGVPARANIHHPDDPLPSHMVQDQRQKNSKGEVAQTWGELAEYRTDKQSKGFQKLSPEEKTVEKFPQETGKLPKKEGVSNATINGKKNYKSDDVLLKTKVADKINRTCNAIEQKTNGQVRATVLKPSPDQVTKALVKNETGAKAAHAAGIRAPQAHLGVADGLMYCIDTIDREGDAYARGPNEFTGVTTTRTSKTAIAQVSTGEIGAHISVLEVRASGPSACAAAGYSYTSVHASASAKLAEVTAAAGPVRVTVGVNLTTGVSAGVSGVSLNVLGFGFSLGLKPMVATPFFSIGL